MKASVYIATSLDGFIARENGSVDWLPVGADEDGEDYGYQVFMDSVNVLVFGRNTYELVLSFDNWPYGDMPVVVLSSQALEIPGELTKTVSMMNATPKEIVEKLSGKGYQHLYVDGGNTIQSFIREGLIQEIIITKIPVLIGNGIPLFGEISEDIHLQHIKTQQYKNGFIQSKYEIIKN